MEDARCAQMSTKSFTKSQKLEVVRAVLRDADPVNVAARKRGLHPQTVHRWIKEHQDYGSSAWGEKPEKRRKRFSEAFVADAVRRALGGDATLTEVARELNVSVAVLSKWVRIFKTRGEGGLSRRRTRRNAARRKRHETRSRRRRKYSDTFKLDAVKRVRVSDEPVAVIARSLGVPAQLLYEWTRAYERCGASFVAPARRSDGLYPEEFRQEAVRLALNPQNIPAQVARDLGISKGLLSQWVKRYGKEEN